MRDVTQRVSRARVLGVQQREKTQAVLYQRGIENGTRVSTHTRSCQTDTQAQLRRRDGRGTRCQLRVSDVSMLYVAGEAAGSVERVRLRLR